MKDPYILEDGTLKNFCCCVNDVKQKYIKSPYN